MEQQYLIDSNVVIDYLSGKLPETGKQLLNHLINIVPNLSVITKIEVLGFKTNTETTLLLSNFFKDSNVISLSDEITDKTIEIRKQYKIKTPDAIIAATSISNNFTLVTRNTKDFNTIKRLMVVNPYLI
jgi:predicted nucleic acid-binding protein